MSAKAKHAYYHGDLEKENGEVWHNFDFIDEVWCPHCLRTIGDVRLLCLNGRMKDANNESKPLQENAE